MVLLRSKALAHSGAAALHLLRAGPLWLPWLAVKVARCPHAAGGGLRCGAERLAVISTIQFVRCSPRSLFTVILYVYGCIRISEPPDPW